MKGMDSIWFWMWSGIGSWRGYQRPTLDLWPATADLADSDATADDDGTGENGDLSENGDLGHA